MVCNETFLLVIQFLGRFVNCCGLTAGDWYLFTGLHIDVFAIFLGFCFAAGGALDHTGHGVGVLCFGHRFWFMIPD